MAGTAWAGESSPAEMLKMAAGLTLPTPSRRDASFHGQGRRELSDRSVFLFHPPTPSCQDNSITEGVRCRETGD